MNAESDLPALRKKIAAAEEQMVQAGLQLNS